MHTLTHVLLFIATRSSSSQRNDLLSSGNSYFDIVHYKEIARQLTLIEFGLFRRVTSRELIQYACASADVKAAVAPNLARVTSHFNAVSRWVSAAVVDGGPTPEGCARRLQTVLQVRERERQREFEYIQFTW